MATVVSDGAIITLASNETSASDADIGAQTVVAAAGEATAADLTTTQAAFDALVADLNDLKAKMRTAGLLAA